MEPSNPTRLIRIASYNIRKARGANLRRDPGRILQVINSLEADIVVLQEADHRLWDRPAAVPRSMIAAETDFELIALARNDVSLGWHGNAVLVRRSIKVASVAQFALPGFEPRGAVRVDLALDNPVSIIATHLGLMRRHRRRQLDMLRDAIAGHPLSIIAGDFNEWSPTRGLEPLHADFVTHAPGLSYPARRPIAALDRFALSHGLSLQGAGVEQGALARRASDHLPVWADVGLAPDGQDTPDAKPLFGEKHR